MSSHARIDLKTSASGLEPRGQCTWGIAHDVACQLQQEKPKNTKTQIYAETLRVHTTYFSRSSASFDSAAPDILRSIPRTASMRDIPARQARCPLADKESLAIGLGGLCFGRQWFLEIGNPWPPDSHSVGANPLRRRAAASDRWQCKARSRGSEDIAARGSTRALALRQLLRSTRGCKEAALERIGPELYISKADALALEQLQAVGTILKRLDSVLGASPWTRDASPRALDPPRPRA
ncbi:hypothetical protein BOTBODRAFT_48801 [Botryobasidium botryosum FD-172 SS1]|uniref:Uncharacterized protein n=1 Tax=Botryobasidium botryosum (strain FD-172 SS1) TaxID=930990 RepID=A0A067M781_BOTB1|nr:hypothetical protein BOTBODRAFT_48801 [Botryobasidium botryosum FD-172 SS1]